MIAGEYVNVKTSFVTQITNYTYYIDWIFDWRGDIQEIKWLTLSNLRGDKLLSIYQVKNLLIYTQVVKWALHRLTDLSNDSEGFVEEGVCKWSQNNNYYLNAILQRNCPSS